VASVLRGTSFAVSTIATTAIAAARFVSTRAIRADG